MAPGSTVSWIIRAKPAAKNPGELLEHAEEAEELAGLVLGSSRRKRERLRAWVPP